MKIRRQTALLEGRRVHYRYAGNGPPILLIHQSPQHSGAWASLMHRLGDRYTLIAPDTPGFGYSDLLPKPQPSISDLAAATVEFCDAVNLEKFAVIGTHTGAAIAAELGLQVPDRLVHLALDGYPLFDPEERAHILAGYFPENPPRWDGGHLIWAWQRLREQLIFFPWFDNRNEARMDWPLPEPETLQKQILEMMIPGDAYKVGYRAAFEDEAALRPAKQTAVTTYLYRTTDILAPHAQRLSALPKQSHIESVCGAVDELEDRFDGLYGEIPDWPTYAGSSPAHPTRTGTQFFEIGGQDIATHFSGDPDSPTKFLVLHEIAQSADCLAPMVDSLKPYGHIVAPDLPGHGMSNESLPEEFSYGALAETLFILLDKLGLQELHVVAIGASAALACTLAGSGPNHGISVARTLLLDPLLLTDKEAQRFVESGSIPQPQTSGGHLLQTWMRIRDSRLVWPWFDPAGERIRGPGLEPITLQREWLALWLTAPHHESLLNGLIGSGLTDANYQSLPPDTSILLSPSVSQAGRQKALAETHHYECFPADLPTESQLRQWLS